MTTRKILMIIFSVIFIAAFGFVLTWGIINWSTVEELMSGNSIYTYDDVESAYEDGYSTALSDKNEYDELISGYRETISALNETISANESKLTLLQREIKEGDTYIASLESEKTDLNTQINALYAVKSSNENMIASLDEKILTLNGQIATLSDQVIALQGNAVDYENQISVLNGQILELETVKAQLKASNEVNTNTINSLKEQIENLNSQINDITEDQSVMGDELYDLLVRNEELQKSVDYYEEYIASLQSDDEVVATFEFDGSVYDVQTVEKNSLLTVTPPDSTMYVIFNGWTVDGETVDLSTYYIQENTRFVADVTYMYLVTFNVLELDDGEIYNGLEQAGVTVTAPDAPTIDGYEFDGWTVDRRNVVDVSTYVITTHTTFIAKYTKLYTVTFTYEETTISSQTIRNGEYAESPDVTSTAYKVFNGWKVNNISYDVDAYLITADTVFVADITYKYDVIFMADDGVYNTQIVEKNDYAELPTSPTKDKYEFVGWSLDGTTTVDVANYAVTKSLTFTAVFRLNEFAVTFVSNDEVVSTQSVLIDSYATAPTMSDDAFMGWTVNGSTVVDVSTYAITQATTFTAKYGSWKTFSTDTTLTYNGTSSQNSIEISGVDVKAGEKIKLDIWYLSAGLDALTTDYNTYMFNAPDGNECYGYFYNNGVWVQRQSKTDKYGGTAFTYVSDTPLVTSLGYYYNNGKADNPFTITVSCKKDGVITIEWDDQAGFYIDEITILSIAVLR